MSRKNTLQYQLLKGHSLSSSFNSPATFVRSGDNISYQINIFTTNSIGTFAIQVSDDYRLNESGSVANAGNWVTLTLGGGTPSANATNDNINISLNQLAAGAVRLAYTSGTAGTGTCDAFMTTKQLA